jgi:hypothetical protein
METATKQIPKPKKVVSKRDISTVLVKDQSSSRLNELRIENNLTEDYLPGTEAIGAGYFLFGEYARSTSIIGQLFDWANTPSKSITIKGKDYIIPEPVSEISVGEYGYNNVEGETISKFQESFTAKVKVEGSTNFFTGSLSNEYTSTSLTTASNEYCRIQNTIGTWGLNLLNTGDLRQYLKEAVRNKIDAAKSDSDFSDLFRDFGSHFLSGLIMGGRASLASATNKQTVDKTYSNETVAKATYESLTGQLTAEASAKYEESISSFESESDVTVATVGGKVELAANIFSGDSKKFIAWVESVADHPDFVDFPSSNQFIGIWELCEKAEQKEQMQSYFENVWGPAASIKHQIIPDYIDAITTVSSSRSSVSPPAGYTKIPYDLNKDSGGKYIYLCYHSQSHSKVHTNNDCITDIITITGKGAPAPAGYTKLPQDLNQGSGGSYIYLCYKTESYNDNKAIKGVDVVGGNNSSVSVPYDYVKVPGDLNKGSGGKYIYACYSKTS